MTHGRRLFNTATVAVALTAVLALGGCMTEDTEETSEAEQRSAAHGKLIESDLPVLVRAAGWDSITALSEKSCLGTPDPEEASRETKWIGSRSAEMDQAEAQKVADQLSQVAGELGWSAQDGAGPHGDRLYGATKEDLTLVVSHQSSGGANSLTVAIHSPCLEMPAGHTMTRSELDSMYGSSDPLYPNDDRSKFTNGEPKPLPSPSRER